MFKKTKLYVGVTLMVQAVSSIVMFFILLGKKKSVAGAFLALAAVSGAVGGYLLYDCKREEDEFLLDDYDYEDEDDLDCCTCCDDEDDLDLDGELFSRDEEEADD